MVGKGRLNELKPINPDAGKTGIENAENEVIKAIADTMDLYGVTPSIGRLYATMYFKSEPMTLDEMKDDLGMSKPSMSTAVRKLQEIDIVQKVWKKGSRKDLFTAEKNFFNYFSKFFGTKWEREVKLNLKAIHSAESQLQKILDSDDTEESLKERARQDLSQLAESKRFYDWLSRLAKIIDTGEIFDFLPIEEPQNK